MCKNTGGKLFDHQRCLVIMNRLANVAYVEIQNSF